VIELAPERIAAEADAEVVTVGGRGRPERAMVDSRQVAAGDLFFGLPGEHADGGEFAASALAAGAWGVVVDPDRARGLDAAADRTEPGWVLASTDPLRSLQSLARAWRRELDCPTVAITGSVGKTSVKDVCRTMLPLRVHASPENFNTEIGLPLAILSAPPQTEALVLEMAMRGLGQIAELCEIAEPDVAAITNVGPVHLELLGTLEAIAAAKAEVLASLRTGGKAVVPADAESLEPHLDDILDVLTFGPGGDVFALEWRLGRARDAGPGGSGGIEARVGTPAGEESFHFPFTEEHNLANALCAIAIGVALGAPVAEMARRAPQVAFSRLRGELVGLGQGIVIVNDCYNANPVSMRAALDHLGSMQVTGRRLAVLGGMLELGPDTAAYHREVGAHARGAGVEKIVGVGELARDYAPDAWAPDADSAAAVVEKLLRPGDAMLVKGSRAIGLERLTDELAARRGPEA
jgi:UDP-N-acetylmuramoyl-tripeptide--D-alanyl-D-alanine ligase